MSWPKESPATEPQMRFIEFLLKQLGYQDPRRDPLVRQAYGWTQRQAKGHFTFAEAAAAIDQLKADVEKQGTEIDPGEFAGLG